MQREQIRDYFGDYYRPEAIVVAAAGNLDHDQFVAAVARKFEPMAGGEPLSELAAPLSSARILLKNKKALEHVMAHNVEDVESLEALWKRLTGCFRTTKTSI